ncbi:MAG: Fic family protein [Erysipelotrichaceae bacterium]|nr:Fic family protein [Erysipelotrichaceae bacterium]
MKNDKILNALEKQFNEKYYTAKELEYANVPGTLLTPFEYQEFLEYKESIASDDNAYVKLLPLPAFNFKCLYYSFGKELSSTLETYMQLAGKETDLTDRFSSTYIESRIYSEIEGSVNVENVPTTRRRLKELLENDAPAVDINDIIIKNMKAGIDFVHELPEFNKENLFRLYTLLSKDCLNEDSSLRPGDYYRYDEVEISRYHGCPFNKINESMNALFEFVKQTLHSKNINEIILLPHICHYYVLYIHPYFDYNGRTARMVSYWVYLLSGLNTFPPIVSEAINQTKSRYYQAIELSRDSHNDLTYFLLYLLNISLDYLICYQNLNHLEQTVKNKGSVLTETELNYIKKIIISYNGIFSYSDFLKMANVSMSKQGALKILNRFVKLGILKEVSTPSKSKLFDIDRNNVPYTLKYQRIEQ